MSAEPDTAKSPPGKAISLPAWLDGSGPSADVIVSTRIRIARNLNGHCFPFHASASERTVVYEKVTAALRKQRRFRSYGAINFSGLGILDQRILVEKRIASPDLLQAVGDRGVVFDPARPVTIMVNEQDHLRLQCLDSGCRPLEAWAAVDALDEQLGRELDIAYNDTKGFLTSSPFNSGTGLGVSYLMHLPGLVLTRAADAVLQGASQMGVSARSFFGDHSAVVGSFFQLSNQAGIGANENDFLQGTRRTIEEVLGCEKEARVRILSEAKLELTDKIFRAWGILQQARTLSVAEFLNLTSALRLGIDCGLFNGFSVVDLNRATLLIMPAHLQKRIGRELDERECSVARAELVRDLLVEKKKRGSGKRFGPQS